MSDLNNAAALSDDSEITGASPTDRAYNEVESEGYEVFDTSEYEPIYEEDGPASSGDEPAEAQVEIPRFRVEFDGEEREFTPDEIREMYNQRMLQEDYTRKTQQMAEWYRQNEERIRAVQVLDMWMQTYPEKAAKFHSLLFDQQEAVEAEDQYAEEELPSAYMPNAYDQQVQNQQNWQQAQQWFHAAQQAQALQAQREDLELDYHLSTLRKQVGDFDEQALLHYMHTNQVYNPQVAYHALRGIQTYQAAPQPAPQPSAPTAVVESSKTRGSRGVRAATAGNEEGPVKTKNWDHALKLAMREFGD